MAEGSNSGHKNTSFMENGRRWKKRPHPPVYNGCGLGEEKNQDFLCPICFEMINEAHMTKCGHTFCYDCITTSLEYAKRCPKCNFTLESAEDIFPNFLLNELIAKQQNQTSPEKKKLPVSTNNLSELHTLLAKERGTLTISEINAMLEVLGQKKQQLEADCRENQIILLKEFLTKVKIHKNDQLRQIQQQLKVVDHDISTVEDMLRSHAASRKSSATNQRNAASCSTIKNEPSTSSSTIKQEGFNGTKYVHRLLTAPTLASRRKRISEHFEDLEQNYLGLRAKDFQLSTAPSELTNTGFKEFEQDLCVFSRYSNIRALATLNYTSDNFLNSNIVSSIEFDKDNEFFAIAGVTKKIKVFEYGAVIRDSIDLHYPVTEMLCNSKISCLSWSPFDKTMLASSDYEGTVNLWDAFSGQKVQIYQEHEKRCWSVDFNRIDTQLIASASDDGKVKLWATNLDNSVSSLETKANICCVKFNPDSRHHLAFGSADHSVHYYDLRNTSHALQVCRGHRKAVSYVKFLNGRELVSASTDGNLKLWNVNQSHCLRSFKGHVNEKNFVGLATDGDFITCGSENNSLYVYFKGLCTQVLTFKFDALKSILDREKREEESNDFVSAVCWRTGSNVIVAANSQGNIKILELF